MTGKFLLIYFIVPSITLDIFSVTIDVRAGNRSFVINFRMRTMTKKDIIALFHHFINTSDGILILTSPVIFRHIQFDIFKRFDSNLSHPQLRDVGRKTGINIRW